MMARTLLEARSVRPLYLFWLLTLIPSCGLNPRGELPGEAEQDSPSASIDDGIDGDSPFDDAFQDDPADADDAAEDFGDDADGFADDDNLSEVGDDDADGFDDPAAELPEDSPGQDMGASEDDGPDIEPAPDPSAGNPEVPADPGDPPLVVDEDEPVGAADAGAGLVEFVEGGVEWTDDAGTPDSDAGSADAGAPELDAGTGMPDDTGLGGGDGSVR
jgi:hypothetical protein